MNDPRNYAEIVGDTLRLALTPGAARTALATLVELAMDGDLFATRVLAAEFARRLGHTEVATIVETMPSVGAALDDERIPALLRFYLMGFTPRELFARAESLGKLSTDASLHGNFVQFQRVVRRKNLFEDEILKAYCVAIFAATYDMMHRPGHRSNGSWLNVLDNMVTTCRVVDGGDANSNFEIGRDRILSHNSIGFQLVLSHEMGHKAFGILQATEPDSFLQQRGPSIEDLSRLEKALPNLINTSVTRASSANRAVEISESVTMMLTRTTTQTGSYWHCSLTEHGGPIAPDLAIRWTIVLLDIFGVPKERAAYALSRRGMFHFGITDEPAVKAHANGETAENRLARLEAESDVWLGELQGRGKIGKNEKTIATDLAVRLPEPAFFPADPTIWEAQSVCNLIEKDQLKITSQNVEKVMNCSMRCAFVPVVGALIKSGVSAEPHMAFVGSGFGIADVPGRPGPQLFGPTIASTSALLRILHAMGVNMDSPLDETGSTLLLEAVRQESDSVELFLSLGANPNVSDKGGQYPLHASIGGVNVGLTAQLLNAGAKPDNVDRGGTTALALAVSLDDLGAAAELIKHHVDIRHRAADGSVPLSRAVSKAAVELLLANSGEVDEVDLAGRTPLSLAAERHSADVVKALLDAGSDAEIADDLGLTALHYAALPGEDSVSCLNALLDARANPNDESRDGRTPLMIACALGNVDAVALLIERGADVNAQTLQGETSAMLACDPRHQYSRDFNAESRRASVVKLLVDNKGDLDLGDANGVTALHRSVSWQSSALLRALLQYGAAPDPQTPAGHTPLMSAVANHHSDMVEALIEAGADVNARDADGTTPLGFAEQLNARHVSDERKEQLINQLLSFGATR